MKNDDKYIEQLLGVALDDSVESSPPELKTEEELAAEGIEPHEFSKGFEQRMSGGKNAAKNGYLRIRRQ